MAPGRKFRSIGALASKGRIPPATHDAWADTEKDVKRRDAVSSGEVVEHKDHMTAGQQFQARGDAKRQHKYKPPSARVLLPHAGSSYNPEESQRQKAVEMAAAELVRQERLGARIEKAQPQFLKRRRAAKRDREEDEEEAGSDSGSDVEEQDRKARKAVEVDEEDAGEEAPKKKLPKRKTTAQRNKEAATRLEHVKKMRRKQQTDLLGQVEKLAEFSAELKKQKEEREARRAKKKVGLKEKDAVRIRRIGGVKYRQPAVHVLGEGEITSNLRTQQIGDVAELPLKERFLGLQERNWLGSAAPRKKRKVAQLDKYRTFTKYTQ